MDDSNFVRDKPALNDVWQKIEPDDQRQTRLLLLGTPTMLKRHNVTRHFTISAALVVLTGPQGAEAAGLGKEIPDSRGGDGFSFADLCADMAGVMFATHVTEGNIPLDDVAARFQVEDYVPKLEGLPDDLSWDSFVKQYGQAGSENFQRQRADLFHRILALPAYRRRQLRKRKDEPSKARRLSICLILHQVAASQDGRQTLTIRYGLPLPNNQEPRVTRCDWD